MRVISLLLCVVVLCSCFSSRGRVDPTVTTGVWGGALIVGGVALAAGTCQPSAEQCDGVDRGSPATATALVITGIALVGLSYLFYRAEARRAAAP